MNKHNAFHESGDLAISRLAILAAIAIGVVVLALAVTKIDIKGIITMGLFVVALVTYIIDVPIVGALERKHPGALVVGIVAFVVGMLLSEFGEDYTAAMLMFPLLTLAVVGERYGRWISIVLGVLWMLMLFVRIPGNPLPVLDLSTKIIYLSLYIALHLLVQMTIYGIRHREARYAQQREGHMQAGHLNAQVLSQLSHDIRVPLNSILMSADMIAASAPDIALVDHIHQSIKKLEEVLDRMDSLALSGKSDRLKSQREFDLGRTLTDLLSLLKNQEPDLYCTYSLDHSLPQKFEGTPIDIKQILLNLVECISQHKMSAKANVNLSVRASRELEGLHIELRANSGLRPPTLPQFTTPDTLANRKELIADLGISFSELLIQKHGGVLHINLGNGTSSMTFDYAIAGHGPSMGEPETVVGSSATSPVAAPQRKKTQATQMPVDLSKVMVLLAEDNQINQKIVTLSLDKMVKGIDVANNGREALDKFATSKYDIILMDVQMPVMNGFVAVQKIREMEANVESHTPVIAITANALMGDREECLKAGMDDYISKPFQVEELVEKMERLLAAKQ